MVKVTLELTEHDLEIFSHCIETALDIDHMKSEQDKNKAYVLLNKLNEYIPNPKV